jgi:hypothetical protein
MSIPVRQLQPFMKLLEEDVLFWIDTERPRYESGRSITWDDKSGAISEYFKCKRIDPKSHQRYSSFFVEERHDVALSYVWSLTTFSQILEELQKPCFAGKRIWIDVLVNKQFDMSDVVGMTKDIYSGCEVLVMLTDKTFSRAWCCFEAACYAKNECELHVCGACTFIQGHSYFESMTTSVLSDLPSIKREIECMFGSGAAFNRAIDDAIIIVYAACGRAPSHLPVDSRFFGVTTQIGRMNDGHSYEAWQVCSKPFSGHTSVLFLHQTNNSLSS